MKYTILPNVVMNDFLEKKLIELFNRYVAAGGKKDLIITSGLRTTDRQACAMYENEKNNAGVKYKKEHLYNEIKAAFNAGYYAKDYPKEKTIADMRKVLDKQVSEGNYLSPHMVGNALDFSLEADEAALTKACKELNHFLYKETVCFHVTFS